MADNLFTAAAKITLDTSEYEKGMHKASSTGKKFSSGFKKSLSVAAKAGGAAIGAAATGLSVMLKKSVDAYGEYEQLVGGVETLFGNASGEIMKYANQAYKTAGMSANEYMETATGFAAALVQSTGGNMGKASKLADVAITDMSDNANKMGTSIESIKVAYQGFAKQNYTMLDNLKLGYGGTKTEMERLVKDAAKLDKSIDANSLSYGNIVKAIHAVQEETGIAGTTAKEAATTIQGSINTMKGAWTNLITGLAGDQSKLDGLLDEFVDSVITVGDNILPKLPKILDSIASLIQKIAPKVIELLPKVAKQILPGLLKSATDIVSSLLQVIPDVLVTVAQQIPALFKTLIQTITDNLPVLIEAATAVIDVLCEFLEDEDNVDTLMDAAIDIIMKLSMFIAENAPKIIEAAVALVENLVDYLLDPDNMETILNGAIDIIMALGEALIKSAGLIVKSAGKLVEKLIDAIMETDWIQVGKDIIDRIGQGLLKFGKNIGKFFGDLFGGGKGKKNGSHRSGLKYVPRDGYMAELHKGEMVLTAEQAKNYRSGAGQKNVTYNIYTPANTVQQMAQDVRSNKKMEVLFGV